MAQEIVTKPYQHDVQANGTPMVPSTANPQIGVVPVANYDGSPVGGGQQYTDGGSAVAHPTGTAVIFQGGSNVPTVVSAANPLPVTGGAGGVSAVDEAAWVAGTSQLTPIGGVFNDSAAALTSGQQGTVRLTANRAIHTNLRSQNGTELLPVTAVLADTTTNPTLTQISNFPMIYNGTTWDRMPGDKTNGVYVNIKSSVSLGVTGTFWQTTQPVSLAVLPATGVLADTTANPTLTQIQVFPMGFNGTTWDRLRGDTTNGAWVNVKTGSVAVSAQATGGYTPGKLISAATTNATSIKASAGTLGGLQIGGNTATVYYVKLYDKASAPTVGTDTPIATYVVPANSTNGAGNNIPLPSAGMLFANGIALAITGGIADSDNTACAANAVVVNYQYK